LESSSGSASARRPLNIRRRRPVRYCDPVLCPARHVCRERLSGSVPWPNGVPAQDGHSVEGVDHDRRPRQGRVLRIGQDSLRSSPGATTRSPCGVMHGQAAGRRNAKSRPAESRDTSEGLEACSPIGSRRGRDGGKNSALRSRLRKRRAWGTPVARLLRCVEHAPIGVRQ
jgi:hypothetical protein